MSRRTRIFIGILLIYTAGIAFLLYRVALDIDPRYRESAEESMVETAQLMAAFVEQHVVAGAIDTRELQPLFDAVYARNFSAQIYNLHKRHVDLRLLVTDRAGRVLFDSRRTHVGEDYGGYRDIARTLAGEYGARTSRENPRDPASVVMWVGAPVRWGGEIVGAVSLGKPVRSFEPFVENARARTLWLGAGSALALLVFALILSVWLVRPFGLIRDYLRWLHQQPGLPGPVRLLRRAADTMRSGVSELRDALTGRSYVADYVQTFTHEIKSPLSAIRGAAELLQESGMPEGERERFLGNILGETQRIREIVDRMMELTALEARRGLDRSERFTLSPLLQEVMAGAESAAGHRRLHLILAIAQEARVEGDPFLLRQAVSNLLSNAMDFSPEAGEVVLALHVEGRFARISVRDHGPGIPDYAKDKVFQKFYSLARPHTQKRSTGLGLAFVREIAALHRARVSIENHPRGGALATLVLPLASRQA